jgi:hypothetical protein
VERINWAAWPPLEGDADMTGSSLAPILIPAVVVISLAAWIFMVYHADSHPYWRGQATTLKQPRSSAPSAAGQRPELSRRQATSTRHAEDPTARPHRIDERGTPRAA